MVALSSSQKKTVFAVILLALIAAGVMISGRGGFSGLRSDVFNNPSFVCTEATQASGKAKYDQSGAEIEKLTAEKTKLEAFVKKWSSDIRKSETLLAKSEKEKAAAEKEVKNIEKYIKDSCSSAALKSLQRGGRAGNTNAYKNRQQICNQKTNDLLKAKQNVNTIQAQIVKAKTAIAAIGHGSITNVQGQISSLEQKIQEAKNYREDYETCNRALEKEKTEVASFDLIVSGEVFVNEPFDITVRAMKSADTVNNKYEGKILFDTNNNPADVVLPLQENDGGSEYQFQAADNGIKLFTKGLTLKKAGTYEIVVFELRGSNGGIEKKVQIVAKENGTDKCNNISGLQTIVPAGTAQNGAGACVCRNEAINPPNCTPKVILPDPEIYREYFFLYDDKLSPTYVNGYRVIYRLAVPNDATVRKMTIKIVDKSNFIESIGFGYSSNYIIKPVTNGEVTFDNLELRGSYEILSLTPNYSKRSTFTPGDSTQVIIQSLEYTVGTNTYSVDVNLGSETKMIGIMGNFHTPRQPGYFKNGENIFLSEINFTKSLNSNPFKVLTIPVWFDFDKANNISIKDLKLLGADGNIVNSSTIWINPKQAIIKIHLPLLITQSYGFSHNFTINATVTGGKPGDVLTVSLFNDPLYLELQDTTNGVDYNIKGSMLGVGGTQNTIFYKS